ncbi:AraC family transcriptional regulator [Sinobacterium caligoides]|uniref:AraC family transcriptional regulator n=1 Tax=Sinobacterium caligoides TaxID=933926 RepID=A0A3N2DN77_9GAMM|nr:helix-turn-helix transcriptional regulator [Sinobacterium caligoides]ROS01267.1 AraC family transcriptional regulator [Sinobacterium caligoides]
MAPNTNFFDFDSDQYPQAAVAIELSGSDQLRETPPHQHHKGQLVLALHGYITCNISDAIWIVPPRCAVWIPGQLPHSNQFSADAHACILFIDPQALNMPVKGCTLSITPMLCEMIKHLASLSQHYAIDSPTAKLVEVLLYELAQMPAEQFNFPIPPQPKLHQIANAMLANPADRSSVAEWASRYAMSERTLARLVKQHVGLTFGRWRGQLHIVLALQKLSSGDSVQRVSEELGYESVSAFITSFKKVLGCPPKQYIKAR